MWSHRGQGVEVDACHVGESRWGVGRWVGLLGVVLWAGAAPLAASAVTLSISSPADDQVIELEHDGPASIPVHFALAGGTLAPGAFGIRWHLDSAAAGDHHSASPFTFSAVPKGLHRLTGVPIGPGGELLHSAAASVYVRVSVPCVAHADCEDGNPCSKHRCRAQAGGARCAYASTVAAGCCFTSLECGGDSFCQANGCVECAVDAHCDDGNPCTLNTCVAGQCLRAVQPGCCTKDAHCDDGDACTLDSCELATNTCAHVDPGDCCSKNADCDDGDPCTIDRCVGGACASVPHPLKPNCCQSAADCDDGDACTLDACESESCVHSPIAGCCASVSDCPAPTDPCTVAACQAGGCAVIPGPCTFPLPWAEGFSAGDLEAADFTVEAVGASPAWSAAAQGWARLTLPEAVPGSSTEHWLVSPLLDASAASGPLTLQWRQGFVGSAGAASFELQVRYSLDGGQSWQASPLHSASSLGGLMPSLAETAEFAARGLMVNVDAGPLAGHAEVRLAFGCVGACGGGASWLLDDIALGEGLPPTLSAPTIATVEEGATHLVPLLAFDPDTAGSALSFSQAAGPGFAFTMTGGDGMGVSVLQPIPGDLGAHRVGVRVSDGFFQDRRAFDVLVTPATAPGGGGGTGAGVLQYVILRDAPGGGGQAVADQTVSAGDSFTYYAAGYDALLEYLQDVNVVWSTTGSLPPVAPGPASALTVTFTTPNTLGRVRASHPNPDIAAGETGTITVLPPPPGSLSAGASTLSASKASLVADGEDTLTLTLAVKDDAGVPYPDPVTVVIQVDAGSMLGGIVSHGDGIYTASLQSASSPATATVTATVNGAPVGNTLTIPMITLLEPLADGVTVIDCTNFASFQGQDLLVRGGTLRINSAGCAPMKLGHLALREGGIVTHDPSSEALTQLLDLEVDSLFVDAGSRIDVNGKGWPALRGPEGATTWASGSRAGGSHGGLGGASTASSNRGIVYDDYRNPRLPGAGGGHGSSGAGGGVVRIRVVSPIGSVALHGSIRARGNNQDNGGGAGGSVYLDTRVLTGFGDIDVRGGNGSSHPNFNSGGGGGGRIAVVNVQQLSGGFAPPGWDTAFEARGGTAWGRGGAGTVFIRRVTDQYGTLIVDNKGVTSGQTPLVDTGLGSWDTLVGTIGYDGNLPSRPADYYAGLRLNANVAQNASATLLDDTWVRVTGSADGSLSVDTPLGQVASEGDAYRTVYAFDRLEVKGRANLTSEAQLLVLSGDVSSGSPQAFAVDGSLSGQTIDLVGVEEITVTNGQLASEHIVGAGSESFPFDYTFVSATVTTATLYAKSVLAVSSTLNAGRAYVQDALLLDGSTMEISDDEVHATLIELTSSSVLRHSVPPAGEARRLWVQAVSMLVESGSVLDANGRGLVAGRGFGNVTTYGSGHRSGGSHGGRGGRSNNANGVSGLVYGDLYWPTEPGSGSGASGSARGGGAIFLDLSGGLVLDGVVRASGSGGSAGGGAGGSVLIVASAVSGTGSLHARGGNGDSHSNWQSGGGGGGRIAVIAGGTSGHFAPGTIRSHSDIRGGGAWNGGGSGTLYFKTPGLTWGNLIVDNAGQASDERSTPLPSVGQGLVDAVADGALVSVAAGWVSGLLQGARVNPRVPQGNPHSLQDDLHFPVTANSFDTLTVQGDPSTVASAGDTFRGIHVFDNLEVQGRARLYMDGDLLVLRGDVESGDDTTLVIDGSVEAGTFDLAQVTDVTLSNGHFRPQTLLGAGVQSPPLDYAFTASTVDLGELVARTLVVNGGTFTAGTVSVQLSATFRGAANATILGDTIAVGGQLTLTENSVLRHAPTTATEVHRLHLTATALQIDAGSRIDGSSRGYLAGRGHGGLTSLGSTGRAGGSHGGLGGRSSTASHLVGPVMDNLYAPAQPGGGAGGSSSARGGGVVRVIVSGAIQLDGDIDVIGQSSDAGAGAGGSVWIDCGSLSGVGRIRAYGGNGSTHSSWRSGGGGGGRVAVYYQTLGEGFEPHQLTHRFVMYGGAGEQRGGAGTVYLKGAHQRWGDLLVDNSGNVAPTASTPLIGVGSGAVASASGQGFTDPNALLPADYAVGSLVWFGGPTPVSLPTAAEAPDGTLTFSLANVFQVTGHSGPAFTLDGDVTAVAEAGTEYRDIAVFDAVSVLGRGSLAAPGDLLVWAGDVHSAEDTTLDLQGGLIASVLELRQVNELSVTNGVYEANRVQGAGVVDPDIMYTFTNAQVSVPALNAPAVEATGGSITTGPIVVTTLTLTGTAATTSTVDVGGGLTLAGNAVLDLTADEVEVGGMLSLEGTSQLRHIATTVDAVRRLHVTAANLHIASGARIDVSARGYTAGRAFGNTTALGAVYRSGGSHGGLGALDSSNSSPGDVYDDLYRPTEPGAGAGTNGSARGGGVVRLEIADSIELHGAIRANGQSSSAGGGAGGSVWIQTQSLAGNGSIEVIGGNGDSHSSWRSGGGGGGRVAIYYASEADLHDGFQLATIRDRLHLQGGNGHRVGGAGTAYLRHPGQLLGDLVVDNRNRNAVAGSTPLIAVPPATVSAVGTSAISVGGEPWAPGRFRGAQVNLNPSAGVADSMVDDPIYTVLDNTTGALQLAGDPTGQIAPGQAFRPAYAFDNLQLFGLARVRFAGDLLVLRGDLESGDDTTLVMQGSLDVHKLDVNQLQTLVASSGEFLTQTLQGGGSTAPMLAFEFTSATVDVPQLVAQSLSVTGGSLTTDTIDVAGAMQMASNAVVTVRQEHVTVGGALTLIGTASLRHPASTASDVYRLHVTANSVAVSSGCDITGSSRGYIAGRGYGNNPNPGTKHRSGGAHGGVGGLDSGNNPTGIAYGNLYAPSEPGGGGGPNGSARGGGAIRLSVASTLTVNGVISADGQSASSGGGAGGSIWIQTGNLVGNGTIRANGGNGDAHSSWRSGSGGGGRIAVHYAGALEDAFGPATVASHIVARAGTAGERRGGAGTIFLKSSAAPWGDLLIHNHGVSSAVGSTPLVGVPPGVVNALTAQSLTHTSAAWLADLYTGYYVNPNVAQGSATSLADDAIFAISGHTSSTLSLLGDPTTVATVGSVFRSLYRLDNLQIAGGARVSTTGDIHVLAGDLFSGDDATFTMQGDLSAHTLDLGPVQALGVTSGTLTVDTLLGQGQIDPRFDIELVSGAIAKPVVRARSWSSTNSTLHISSLDVQEAATFSGGTATLESVVVGGDLLLTAGATLTHPACTTLQEYGLDLEVNRLIVHSGAKIDVSSRGYPAGHSASLDVGIGAKGRSGGSNGGLGGRDNSNNLPGAIINGYAWPTFPGGGGGGTGGSARGGGAVRVHAALAVEVDGELIANGQSASPGGGAGGTIRVVAPQIAGQGQLRARGGNGDTHSSWRSGAGGGGRIALHGALHAASALHPSQLAGSTDVRGGSGQNHGGAGTVYYKQPGESFGSLILDNKGVNAPAGSTPLWTAGIGQSQALGANTLSDPAAQWPSLSEALVGSYVSPRQDQGSATSLEDDVVFRVVNATADTLIVHGGDLTEIAQVGDTYRGMIVLDNLDILGRARVWSNGDLLVYRGDVSSQDDTTLAMDGTLVAERLDLSEATTLVAANGVFEVDRLFRGGADDYPFHWTLTSHTVNLDALHGSAVTATACTLNLGRVEVVGALVQDGGIVTIADRDVEVGATYSMLGNAVLRHLPSVAGYTGTLRVAAGGLQIAPAARIELVGRGYPALRGFGGGPLHAANGRFGGSHGGRGGVGNSGNSPGVVYGDFTWPTEPGAGGGGGTGGGAVQIELSGGLVLDGTIDARGNGNSNGGGAGGAVAIEATSLSGAGVIDVRGGNGNSSTGGGAGGGGRVALRGFSSASGSFAPAAIRSQVLLRGGTGWTANGTGGAGTLFMRAQGQARGDLIVDGTGTAPPDGSTPIVAFGGGTIGALSATSLQDTSKLWVSDLYAGVALNPNVAQGGTPSRTDDTLFTVAGNSLDALQIAQGDLTAVAAIGDTYRATLALDRLDVHSARLAMDGDLIVYQGDLRSPLGAFDVPAGASITAAVIELVTTQEASISGEVLATEALLCADCD